MAAWRDDLRFRIGCAEQEVERLERRGIRNRWDRDALAIAWGRLRHLMFEYAEANRGAKKAA